MCSLAYTRQKSQQTLREGLEEYRAANPNLVDERNASSPAAGRFFRAHDRCHVLFGLDTTIPHEAMADTWTIFGSDVPFRKYLGFAGGPEVMQILSEIGWWKMIAESAKSVPAMLAAWRHARRMIRPWPFWENDAWLEMPLAETRAEFGIEIVSPAR